MPLLKDYTITSLVINNVFFTTDQSLNGLAGSPAYVAPEVLLGNYSEKVDVWSAGVLLYALLSGVLPFKGDSLKDVFEAIKTVKLDFQAGIWEHVSKPARDLLERILTRDASARITADEVLSKHFVAPQFFDSIILIFTIVPCYVIFKHKYLFAYLFKMASRLPST